MKNMKLRITSLLLITVLTLTLLTACKGEGTTSDSLSGGGAGDSLIVHDTLNESVETEIGDTLGAMTPAQAYEAAYTLLSTMTQYEINGTQSYRLDDNGTVTESALEFISKVTDASAYTKQLYNGRVQECWYENGIAYMSENGSTYTDEKLTFEEFKLYYVVAIDLAKMWIDESYIDLGERKFVKTGDSYALTVTMSEDEIEELEKKPDDTTDPTVMSITLRFNAEGELRTFEYRTETSEEEQKLKNKRENTEFIVNIVQTDGVVISFPDNFVDGGLSGKYESVLLGSGTRFEFSGNKVVYSVVSNGETVSSTEGTYELRDKSIIMSFEVNGETVSETMTFGKDDNYIVINGTKYIIVT